MKYQRQQAQILTIHTERSPQEIMNDIKFFIPYLRGLKVTEESPQTKVIEFKSNLHTTDDIKLIAVR